MWTFTFEPFRGAFYWKSLQLLTGRKKWRMVITTEFFRLISRIINQKICFLFVLNRNEQFAGRPVCMLLKYIAWRFGNGHCTWKCGISFFHIAFASEIQQRIKRAALCNAWCWFRFRFRMDWPFDTSPTFDWPNSCFHKACTCRRYDWYNDDGNVFGGAANCAMQFNAFVLHNFDQFSATQRSRRFKSNIHNNARNLQVSRTVIFLCRDILKLIASFC